MTEKDKTMLSKINKILRNKKKISSTDDSFQLLCSECGNPSSDCSCSDNTNSSTSRTNVIIPVDDHYGLTYSTPLNKEDNESIQQFLDKKLESKSEVDNTRHESMPQYKENPEIKKEIMDDMLKRLDSKCRYKEAKSTRCSLHI